VDHVETIGRFAVYWDRGVGAFVVYSSTDELVYTEPKTRLVHGKLIRPAVTALQWARSRDAAYTRTFGDCEPGMEFE
jgi:hypothetical protein